MSTQQAPCPICNRDIPLQSMNRHIDGCLLNADSEDPNQNNKVKDKPGEVLSSQNRKRARTPSESESRSGIDSEFESSPKRCESTDMIGPKNQSVGLASNDEAGTRKKVRQWGSLLRPTSSSKISKVDDEQTPSKKKLKSVASCPARNSLDATDLSALTKSRSFSSSVGGLPKKRDKVEFRPLAERMRPLTFEAFVGQEKAVGQQSLIRKLLEEDVVPSLIFWGPPGCGKTTLANIIAQRARASGKARFVSMSATLASVAMVKDAVTAAANEQRITKRKTILFIDEMHRFNKLQQDTFLPHVENGTITLIGATTENPSFKVNSALLSRCRVIVLNKLNTAELLVILRRATAELGVRVLEEIYESNSPDERSDNNEQEVNGESCCSERPVYIEKTAMTYLANLCDGDARSALNTLQMVVESRQSTKPASDLGQPHVPSAQETEEDSGMQVNGLKLVGGNDSGAENVISTSHIKNALQRTHVMYDREGEEHYNCISALHKSMRGSDANAALYWLARMLVGGEDPLYIARRLIAFACEDVGLADPLALNQAVSTHQACQFLGVPACEVILAQCVIYLSKAPKSSMVECALMNVKQYIQEFQGPIPGVPLHLRPGSTQLMRDLGYGKGYVHSAAAGDQGFLPECMRKVDFFRNTDLVL